MGTGQSCANCGRALPWKVAEEHVIALLKERETSRLRGIITFVQDLEAYLRRGAPFPLSAFRGLVTAILLPRLVIVGGSIIAVAAAGAQIWILSTQTALLERQVGAQLLDQSRYWMEAGRKAEVAEDYARRVAIAAGSMTSTSSSDDGESYIQRGSEEEQLASFRSSTTQLALDCDVEVRTTNMILDDYDLHSRSASAPSVVRHDLGFVRSEAMRITSACAARAAIAARHRSAAEELLREGGFWLGEQPQP